MTGRFLWYSTIRAYGTTVFRPSLPPVISRTTRTVLAESAAWAVRGEKPGTSGLNASSDDRVKNERRVSMAVSVIYAS